MTTPCLRQDELEALAASPTDRRFRILDRHIAKCERCQAALAAIKDERESIDELREALSAELPPADRRRIEQICESAWNDHGIVG